MRWPNSSDVAAFEAQTPGMDFTKAADKVIEGGQLPFTRLGVAAATYWDDETEAAWQRWWAAERERAKP